MHRGILKGGLLLTVWFAGCTGSTGVGNPETAQGETTGTTALEITANPDTFSLAKEKADSAGHLSIVDAGGLSFLVKSAVLTVSQVVFGVSAGPVCLDDFTGPTPFVSCKGGEVILTGPVVFNLLTGKGIPDVSLFDLPVGAYERLTIRPVKGPPPGQTLATVYPDSAFPLAVTGIFAYGGRTDRVFKILLNFSDVLRFQTQTPVSIRPGPNETFSVFLDFSRLLEGIDIAGCLDKGSLTLDSGGGLFITSLNPGQPCANAPGNIEKNLQAAGRLRGKKK